MSNKAKKANRDKLRNLHLNRRSGTDLSDSAEGINPYLRDWINYCGAFYRSGFYPYQGLSTNTSSDGQDESLNI
ncbi:group II intron maturase-specific domain-containing protein [Ferrithrix thermotolerans]|uniref:group II intron maturase-specific domain-containing protein n=1 Tax=Ferrithrix thermotolerans TaxID=209649 RepID=UPI000A029B84